MSSVPSAEVYLAPGFEPADLKVAQLRGILVEHQINAPATAKKADLISLFQTEVLPKAGKLQKKNAKVQPSSAGIVEVDNDGVESVVSEEPVKKKRGRPRKTAAAPVEEDEGDGAGAEASTTNRRRTLRSSATPGPALGEDELPAATRKSGMRKSVSAPSGLVVGDGDAAELKKVRKKPSVSVLREESEDEGKSKAKLPDSGMLEAHAVKPATAIRKSRYSGNGDESGFSDFNPFQSGGEGTPGGLAASMKERKKRKSTLGGPSTRPLEDTKSSRHSDPPREPQAVSSSPKTPTSPLRKFQPRPETIKTPPKGWQASDVDSGEADGKDVDVSVVEQRSALTKARPARQSVSRTGVPFKSILLPALLLGLGSLTWKHKVNNSAIGYCDTGSSTNDILAARQAEKDRKRRDRILVCEREISQIGSEGAHEPMVCDGRDWLEDVLSYSGQQCTPCPVFGECNSGDLISCADGYVEEAPPLALLNPLLDGLADPIAFPSRCVLDPTVAELTRAIAVDIERELSTGRGQIICSKANIKDWWQQGRQLAEGHAHGLEEAEVLGEKENDLVARYVSKRNDEVYGEAAWQKALDEGIADLISHGNLVRHKDDFGTSYLMSTRSIVPWQCRLKMTALKRMSNYRRELTGSTIGLLIGLYLYARFKSTMKTRSRTKRLVDMSLQKLQDQDCMHRLDSTSTPEPWLAPAQLRDAILMNEHNPAKRQKVWSRVQPIVAANANVRVLDQELADGALWEVWQWVGVQKLPDDDATRHVTWQD